MTKQTVENSSIQLTTISEDQKKAEPSKSKKSNSLLVWLPREAQLLVCISCVYIFYMSLGGYQEKLLTKKYGEEKLPFPSTLFLLASMCLGNVLVAIFQIQIFKPHNTAPFCLYWKIAIPYLGAMVCSYGSVGFIDFPTQVLAKSCKPIPVMFMGVLYLRKKYPFKKYIFVLLITVGVAMFSLANPKTKENATTTLEGILLLCLSLFFDAITGPLQESIRESSSFSPSPAHMMLFTNIWACLFSFGGLLVTRKIPEIYYFGIGQHEAMTDLFLLCLCSAFGQIFITELIHLFDSLTCSIVTTTRKLFTLLVSIILFGHNPSFYQWVAIGLVFSGLSLDIISSYSVKASSKVQKKE